MKETNGNKTYRAQLFSRHALFLVLEKIMITSWNRKYSTFFLWCDQKNSYGKSVVCALNFSDKISLCKIKN